jgi:hypothetical protein
MRAAVALLLCISVTACFPGNKKNQRYAKLAEGGSLVAGIAILAVANTGADCDMQVGLGMPKADCKGHAGLVGGIGLALIVAGLVGFAATVTTAGDDDAKTTTTPPSTTTTPAQKPEAPSTTPTPITPAPTKSSLMQLPAY